MFQRNKWFIIAVLMMLLAKLNLTQATVMPQTAKLEQSDIRIDPPNWFVGMENETLELLLHAPNIGSSLCELEGGKGIELLSMEKMPSKNYLLLKLHVSKHAPPQAITLLLRGSDGERRISYQFLSKKAQPKKIDGRDVLYLIMPDRFANGNPDIDDVTGMEEKSDRTASGGKHGGDIQGVINHLDYLEDLGVTTVWLNPVYENNMKAYSYHGYSITDHYKIDPRLGDLKLYRQLCTDAHDRGMKVIKDMIFNHIGLYHYWIDDLPDPDWVTHWPEFTRTNYSGSTVTDPYASEKDKDLMTNGWFDVTMPDLNQKSKTLMTYLTQHSIWWIEMAGIDGVRMDTYPYPEKKAMAKWVDDVLLEYPDFFIVGETWLYTPQQLAYWTKNNLKSDYSSNLPAVSDFGITWAIDKAFREEKGLWELYQILTNDFIYQTPNQNKIFVDNHDMERSFGVLEQDMDKFLMAYTFLFTTRGIPQYFYGTEIGMSGGKPDGNIREDMPGGWEGDEKNVFTGEGLNPLETQILEYKRKLLNWRKSKKLFSENNLVHFIPDQELYVYGRRSDDEGMVVLMNNDDKDRALNFEHYAELFVGFNAGVEVISDRNIENFNQIVVPAKSTFIIDLMNN